MKLIMRLILSFLLVSVVAGEGYGNSDSDVLKIHVHGLSPGLGSVIITVFSGPDGFPQESKLAFASHSWKVDKTDMTVEISGMKPNNYAVAMFQDENDDHILNRHFLGYPSELFGFSRDPKIYFGPPSFSASEFSWTAVHNEIDVTLHHWGL
jgi:uncharacterized protein (DUF2141 family)